jgi:hypothetical protein
MLQHVLNVVRLTVLLIPLMVTPGTTASGDEPGVHVLLLATPEPADPLYEASKTSAAKMLESLKRDEVWGRVKTCSTLEADTTQPKGLATSAVLKKLNEIRDDCNPDDAVLVYLSGHGGYQPSLVNDGHKGQIFKIGAQGQGVLGVELVSAEYQATKTRGARVKALTPSGAAATAGIPLNSLIVRFDGTRVTTALELQKAVQRSAIEIVEVTALTPPIQPGAPRQLQNFLGRAAALGTASRPRHRCMLRASGTAKGPSAKTPRAGSKVADFHLEKSAY